ncbi:MAG: hypothetical protein ACYSTS_07665 [Planctomycetota bacterium]
MKPPESCYCGLSHRTKKPSNIIAEGLSPNKKPTRVLPEYELYSLISLYAILLDKLLNNNENVNEVNADEFLRSTGVGWGEIPHHVYVERG